MASDEKPINAKFRKGRWFWEPSAKIRLQKGIKGRALGADQVQAWAMARKLNQELLTLADGGKSPGTVAWLFEQFFATEKFTGLAKSTQTDYRWLAKRINKVLMANRLLADFNAMAIKARHADVIIDQIKAESGHSTSHYCARFARRVWKWAGRKEFVNRADNPFSGMELKGLPERDQLWTPEQVATLIAKAYEPGQKPSIGLASHIAYSFAHRMGDVLTLTWTALDSGIRKTSKTGVKLPMVPSAYPDLETAIAAERQRQKDSSTPSTHVIVCEMTGRPWHPDVFSHHFRQLANAAEIPSELQARDLRATAMTEMNDGGGDIIDMSTHSGHKDPRMALRYARRTPEQFQRAAAKRQANKAKPAVAEDTAPQNEAKTASGTPSGTREHPLGNPKKL